MNIGSNNIKFNYEIYNERIEECKIEKDLGIMLNNNLKTTPQCIEAQNKANKLLGYITKKVHYKSKEIL